MQQKQRSENAPSGRLQEVQNNGKLSTVRLKKWSQSLTGGGHLLEVPTVRLSLGKFWCFGLAIRWSHIWRLDCNTFAIESNLINYSLNFLHIFKDSLLRCINNS